MAEAPTCSCCGEERDRLVGLHCRDDVQVCPACVGWLRARLGVVDSTPILPVRDMDASIVFYERAGFDVRRYDGGGYSFVTVDYNSVFDLDVTDAPMEPATNYAGCYLIVPAVDEWHDRLASLDLDVTAVEDQPWGMREFTLVDPSGNRVRFGQST